MADGNLSGSAGIAFGAQGTVRATGVLSGSASVMFGATGNLRPRTQGLTSPRVQETSTSTGTDAFVLDGAPAGMRTFASAFASGQLCGYAITNQDDPTQWEIGVGTYDSASNSITRTNPIAGSVNAHAVDFGAGTKYVLNVAPTAANGETYSASTYYTTGSVVTFGGLLWFALQPSQGEEPDTSPTYWGSVTGVSSFNGRQGAVEPQSGDYTLDIVGDGSARFAAVYTADEQQTLDAQATAATTQLAAIASDGTISPAEKPAVIRDYSVVTTNQATIDAQAVAFLGAGSTQQADYDTAISTLTAYLDTLTTPVAWNDKSGNTTVVAATFDADWNAVYTAERTLLNAIATQAKTLANNAQDTANEAIDELGNLDGSQYVQNPFFTSGDLTGWQEDNPSVWSVTNASATAPDGTGGSYALRTGSATYPTGALRNLGKIPAYPGAVLKAQCLVAGFGTPDGTCGVRISWRNVSDAEISNTDSPAAPAESKTSGNGTNGTYVTGAAPAGTVWAHVECAAYNHTAGTYSIDNFAAWALADNATQLSYSDGSTVESLQPAAAGADVTADNTAKDTSAVNGVASSSISPIAGLMPAQAGADVTANNTSKDTSAVNGLASAKVSNGISILYLNGNTIDSLQPAEAGADVTATHTSALVSSLANQTLDDLADGENYIRTGAQAGTRGAQQITNAAFQMAPTVGWEWASGVGVSQASSNPTPAFGGSCVTWYGAAGAKIQTAQNFPCRAGDAVSVGALVGGTQGVAASIDFYGTGGNYVTSITATAAATAGWTSAQASGVAPGAAAYFKVSLSAPVADVNAWANYVWASVNDVRVAGSGAQLGDMRNQQAVSYANYGAAWLSGSISYSATATSVTFSFSGGTLQVGAETVAYAAASETNTSALPAAGASTTWYAYFNDPGPGLAGGSLPLYMAGTLNEAMAHNGAVLVGPITFTMPSSGSSSGGGGSGGNGTGQCPSVDAYVEKWADGGWRVIRAGEVEVGDLLHLSDHTRGRVYYAKTEWQPCVHVQCGNPRLSLTCSESAPLERADGKGFVDAANSGPSWADLRGQELARWPALAAFMPAPQLADRVKSVDRVGTLRVRHISVDGPNKSFLGGDHPGYYLGHHNLKPLPQ